MRFVNTLPLIFGLTAALGSSMALALPSDREQPIRVQADSAELDDKQGVAVYGDIEVVTSVGKPAYYEQKPAPDKDVTKAYGLTIQYFVTQNRVVLIDQAKVIQEGNTFEGEKIVYDTQRQIVNAGRATGSQVTSPRPRIDMVIQPKKKAQ